MLLRLVGQGLHPARQFTGLYKQEEIRFQKAEISRQYVADRTGATKKILAYTNQILSGKRAY